jgi:hypothetical protein
MTQQPSPLSHETILRKELTERLMSLQDYLGLVGSSMARCPQ